MARALAEIFVVNIIFGPAGVVLWLALDAALVVGAGLGVLLLIMRRPGGGGRALRPTLGYEIALPSPRIVPTGISGAVTSEGSPPSRTSTPPA